MRKGCKSFDAAGVWAAKLSGVKCLEQMEAKVGDNPPGRLRHETAEAKAERLIAEERMRLQCSQDDLVTRHKRDPSKLAIAARLRQETTLSIKQIAERLPLGKPKGAKANLHKWLNQAPTGSPQIQLGI